MLSPRIITAIQRSSVCLQQVRLETSTAVLLLQNVESLGEKGDVVAVKRSFAGNYLIPKQIAEYASDDGVKRLKKVPQGVNMAALSNLSAFQSKPIVFKKLSRFDGSIYAQVTRPEIKAYFVKQGCHVSDVVLSQPIKSVGTHNVTVDGFPLAIRVVGFH